MPTPFLSSEEYDERAHQLYNEGQYEEALAVLREGLTLYPSSVELHVGVGYARLARCLSRIPSPWPPAPAGYGPRRA